MSKAEKTVAFLLAAHLPTCCAVDRIARWDEFTEPGEGWDVLDMALHVEQAKGRPRARVVAVLEIARQFAGAGDHPANLMPGGVIEWRAAA